MIHSLLSSARRVGLMLATLTLAMAGLVLVAAPAEAHGPTETYSHDVYVAPGAACPTGYTANGKVTTLGNGCRPDGYVPVTDVAECNSLPFGGWDAATAACVIDFNMSCLRPDATVMSAAGTCHRIWLESGATAGGANLRTLTPVCIESDKLQDGSAYDSLNVGSTFFADGKTYVVTTGAPLCNFGCEDGFDANCDGRLGDFCRVELSRTTVGDVGKCLAERSTATNAPR